MPFAAMINLLRPFQLDQLFNGYPDCLFFCMEITTFLEKSKFKVESLLRMHRNTCEAWYEVCWPEKVVLCLHLLYWSWCWSFERPVTYCWLLALNIAAAHGLLRIVGKVRGCFVLVKSSSTWICVCLLRTCKRSQASTATSVLCINYFQFHSVLFCSVPERSGFSSIPLSHGSYAADPCWLYSPAQNNLAHSRCASSPG